MENLSNLLMGFATVFSLENLGVCLLGSILGLIVGAMPGIGSLAGVALLLPLTYKFDPTAAIIMLGALYYSNMYGGAFSAILLNVPGDSPAVMTVLDGHPMAEKGQPGQALFTSNLASCVGGLVGMLILTFLGPALAEVGLKFGPAEMTSLMIMSLMSIGWLLGDDTIKGTVSTMVGFLLASIGMDTLSGTPRFEFGNMYLLGGIPFVAFVIGAVGLSQVIDMMGTRHDPSQIPHDKLTIKGSLLSKHQLRRMMPPAIRSGFIGTFVGVLPGSGATAIMMGALMMLGLTPGPSFFTREADVAWGLIASMYLGNVILVIIGVCCLPLFVKILNVKPTTLNAMIFAFILIGAYALENSMFTVGLTLFFGVIGYIFKKLKVPAAPMVLALVLGALTETNLRQALIIDDGNIWAVVTHPISAVILILALLLAFGTPIKGFISKLMSKRTAA